MMARLLPGISPEIHKKGISLPEMGWDRRGEIGGEGKAGIKKLI